MQSGSGVYALNHFNGHKKKAGCVPVLQHDASEMLARGVSPTLPNIYDTGHWFNVPFQR